MTELYELQPPHFPHREYNERIGDLEVDVGIITTQLAHTTNILDGIQDTLKQQTDLLSRVLVIQEKQDSFKSAMEKVREDVGNIEKRQDAQELKNAWIMGWAKGVGLVGGALIVVLTYLGGTSVARLNKLETDFYKPIVENTSSQ